MFFLGILAASVVLVVIWLIFPTLRKKPYSHSDVFYKSAPFLAASIFAVVFLCIALAIEVIFLKEASYYAFLVNPKTYVSVFKEFFFASVIALFIIATIEISSRSELENFVKASTTQAQKDVFRAVYQNRLNADVFAEAEASIFETEFVRTHHTRDIHLRPLNDSDDYILLTSTQQFRVQNVSGSPKTYVPTVYLPKTLEKFRQHVCVTNVQVFPVDDGQRGECILLADQDTVGKALHDDSNTPDELCYSFSKNNDFNCCVLQPQAELEVHISLTLVKEKYDNEIWTTLIPTLKAEVTVKSDIDGLRLSAIALHRRTMVPSPQASDQIKKWVIERPMLPYQGYVVSWSEGE